VGETEQAQLDKNLEALKRIREKRAKKPEKPAKKPTSTRHRQRLMIWLKHQRTQRKIGETSKSKKTTRTLW
jgi:hypothetical protein